MGRAIVREPQAFLFDEPLSNLDAKLRVQMRVEIRRLHNRLKATSIFVTHDQVEAMTLADMVVVMNAGRIEQIGAPTAGLSPAGDALRRHLHRLAGHEPDARQGRRAPAWSRPAAGASASSPTRSTPPTGREVEVGIRPEDLRFGSGGEGELAFAKDFVEELGATRLIHGTVGRCADRRRRRRRRGRHAGTSLAADRETVHLFDPATGKSLRR